MSEITFFQHFIKDVNVTEKKYEFINKRCLTLPLISNVR